MEEPNKAINNKTAITT